MMKKLALALMLALPSGTLTAATSAHTGSVGSPALDGVSRRASATRPGRRGARRARRAQTARRRRGQRFAGANKGSTKLTTALPHVTEIDGDGLKNLLRRGEAQTARPLLINFWATWCVPCREEFPDLVKIDQEYRGRGLEFVAISADDVTEIKADVPKFLRRMRAEMPAYLLNAPDTEAAMAQIDPAWGGELPATFLFDRHGKLVFKHTGIIKAAQLREQLDKVLSNE